MTQEEQYRWAECAVRVVNNCFPEVRFRTWFTCEQLLLQAQTCIEHIQAWGFKSEEAVRLLHQIALYLYKRAYFTQAERIYKYTLTIIEETQGDHPDLVITLTHLATLYYTQGRYPEAELLYQRALTVAGKVLKPEHFDIATILEGLAALYEIQGNYPEAETRYLNSFQIREKLVKKRALLDPEDYAVVAISLNNLAVFYESQRRYDEAEQYCRKALHIQENALGSEHPHIAITLNNLAAIYEAQNPYAIRPHQKVLKLITQPDHLTATSSKKLPATLPIGYPEKSASIISSITQSQTRTRTNQQLNITPISIDDKENYFKRYEYSVSDPENFWAEEAEIFVTWFKKWDRVLDWDFTEGHIRWFEGAKLNVSYNCLDRHLDTRGDQVAIIWESDNPSEDRKITYRELYEQVCRFANALKGLGVKKGDRVSIYLPMIPEMTVAMLACTRIGAIHSIVFSGFSPEALRDRINDSECSVVITSDEGLRGGRPVPLKANADKACENAPSVRKMIVVKRTSGKVAWQEGRDLWFHELMSAASPDCPPEQMDAEDPLFILYTSGSTGKPKGVLHTTGGYLLHVSCTYKYIFDYRDGEVFWCTADVGWIVGHSYIVYGPLANGAITVMFEGVPTYPSPARFWEVVDKHQVNIVYTVPTAIRMLMREGDGPVKKTSRKTLRLLGSVGEPINPEAWEWYYHVVGDGRCPIVDTWWQTETGGILISPLPGITPLKPGSATRPFFGVVPALYDARIDGKELQGPATGNLVITRPWPGMMRTVYGNHPRFVETYFSVYPGIYFTGDYARRDEDGYYWITGRMDDMIIVSGHRLSTFEVEGALVLHEAVDEAAVVGFPHDIKGQGIYAYVTLKAGVKPSEKLRKALIQQVRKEIGPIATPDIIQWAPGLAKTISGKIIRYVLRKIAAGDIKSLDDASTRADPDVVNDLISNRFSAMAETLYLRALNILERTLNPEHPDVAVTLSNLASLYCTQRRYAEAESQYQRALEIRVKALGPEHPDVANTLSNLALLYYAQDRSTQIEPCCQRALTIIQKSLAPDYPCLANILAKYANLLREELVSHAEDS